MAERWRPTRPTKRWKNVVAVLFGLGAGFGGGVGMTIQAHNERSVGRSYAHASACAPGQTTGCRLTVPGTVLSATRSYGSRSVVPNYDVALRYLGRDHDSQQLIGSHGFSRLYRGEPVIVEVFDSHLLQINAAGAVLKPEWLPGRWKLHLGVAAFLFGIGLLTVLALVATRRARSRSAGVDGAVDAGL